MEAERGARAVHAGVIAQSTAVTHSHAAQEAKYKEASGFYDAIVKKYENLLDASPVVLANLCVACIMTSQNEKARPAYHIIHSRSHHTGRGDHAQAGEGGGDSGVRRP